MQLAIDLTPRQAARVLEQALRARVELEIEPRCFPEDKPFIGLLSGREGELLDVAIPRLHPRVAIRALIGAFCEIQMTLSGELYNFTTCVFDIHEKDDARRLLFTIPEFIQVRNRRQFERTDATVASQVRLWLKGQPAPSVGLLANVSADGLACTLPGTGLDKDLVLGDELQVAFELAGFDEQFALPTILHNKDLTKDKSQLVLGMQFNVQAENPNEQDALERLRAALYELMTNSTDMDGTL